MGEEIMSDKAHTKSCLESSNNGSVQSAFDKYYRIEGNGVLRADMDKLNDDNDFREYARDIFPDIKVK